MQKKPVKKAGLTPEAAKILEQYRNAGKSGSNNGTGPELDGDGQPAPRTSGPSTPAVRQRSGTRGK